MSRIFEIPFDAGQDEGADRLLVPDGRFAMLRNCRLARDGRLEVRPAYTALANTVHDPINGTTTVVPFDLATFRDRLIMFGAPSAATAPVFPREIYTLVQTSAGVWKGSSDNGGFVVPSVPLIQDVEVLFNAPYDEVITSSDIAYANGYLCVVRANASTQNGRIYLYQLSTGTLLLSQSVTAVRSLRVIASGTSFIIGGKFVNGTISAATVGTTGTFVLSSFSTLEATVATDTFSWDMSPVVGSTDFVVSYTRVAANTTRVRRYTSALGLSWTFDIAATRCNQCVIAKTAAAAGVLLVTNEAGSMRVRLLNISTGALLVGPTLITSGITGTPGAAFTNDPLRAQLSSDDAGDYDLDSGAYDITISTLAFGGSSGANNARTISKGLAIPTPIPGAAVVSECMYVGTGVASGNVAGTDQTYSTCIRIQRASYVPGARFNFGFADRLVDANATNYHGRPSLATDGAGTYFGTAAILDDSTILSEGAGYLQVLQWHAGAARRHQTTETQGALYIAGGTPSYYDASNGIVEQGFPETPVVFSLVASAAGGSMTASATYNYVACYEWIDGGGRLHRSAPSVPLAVTLGGGDNRVVATVSSNGGLRWAGTNLLGGIKTVLYRINPNDSIPYRVGDITATTSIAQGTVYAITDTLADTAAEVKPVLYTTSQKPIANVAPLPSRFVAAGKDRTIHAGHPDPYLVTFSQVAFPGEPLEGASPNNFSFQMRMPGPVTGVAVLGVSYLVFTADAIYEIPGTGPQRNGSGEFLPPVPLDTDVGCLDWRSIVVTGAGVFFQGAADKIYLLAGGAPTFVGKPVRDTLSSFPVITGAALCTETQQVVFSCTDVPGSSGVLLVYDTLKQAWFVDDVGPVTSIVEYQGRLALLSAGAVSLEDTAIGLGAAAMPTLSARTGVLGPFQKAGRGSLCRIELIGTYVGDCTVELFVSYDDQKTWTSIGTRAVTAAGLGLTSGAPVNLQWVPRKRDVDRFSVRVDQTNGTNTGGMRMHVVSLEVEAEEFMTRLPARNKR